MSCPLIWVISCEVFCELLMCGGLSVSCRMTLAQCCWEVKLPAISTANIFVYRSALWYYHKKIHNFSLFQWRPKNIVTNSNKIIPQNIGFNHTSNSKGDTCRCKPRNLNQKQTQTRLKAIGTIGPSDVAGREIWNIRSLCGKQRQVYHLIFRSLLVSLTQTLHRVTEYKPTCKSDSILYNWNFVCVWHS